ncbi:MAG: M20/M25/M40 family metallo-hydrolase [Candidatus Margulisiibacteriota bacterium]
MDSKLGRRITELARDLILIPTNVGHPDEIERGVEFVRNHLEDTRDIIINTVHSHGVTSLIALPKDQPEPDIILCAHLDIVYLPDADVTYHSSVKNGRIYGPGAGDMKGALAVLLEVFRDVHNSISGASLGLVVTTDEERGGEHGVKYLFGKKGLRCKTMIIPDAGSLNSIAVEEKGVLHLSLSCEGPSGHASRPWLVDNPLEKLAEGLWKIKALFDIEKDAPDHWHPTCAITRIHTNNEAVNRIPHAADAFCDIRFPPPYKAKDIMTMVREQLGPQVKIEAVISADPTHFVPDPLFVLITEKITGQKVILKKEHGASDARFISALGIPVILSRPEVGNLHSEIEWVDINSMISLYKIYERYLKEKLAK